MHGDTERGSRDQEVIWYEDGGSFENLRNEAIKVDELDNIFG